MKAVGRAFAIVSVFVVTSIAWLVLGGVMMHRQSSQSASMRSQVQELWGRPQEQRAPSLSLARPEAESNAQQRDDSVNQAQESQSAASKALQPISSRLSVDLALDQRLKGLVWHSLYDVAFAGEWHYRFAGETADTLKLSFAFPDPMGVYDDFALSINGVATEVQPAAGGVNLELPVSPGEEITIEAHYKSRGLGAWSYRPGDGVSSLRDFRLEMNTNFDAVDFPENSLSPSVHEDTDKGRHLIWEFSQVVSGYGIGMRMPERLQPGELAADLAFSAPISLLFFFLVIAVLAKLKELEIHPINYFFLAASFFSFHLLFAYSVDHLSVWTAFALASVVSVVMVTAYLRLVVSSRFAFIEAATAQLVYLVGFSLAYFWQGYTGVTITVLSIGTLFLLMLLTGRIRWGQVLESMQSAPAGRSYPQAVPYYAAAGVAPMPAQPADPARVWPQTPPSGG